MKAKIKATGEIVHVGDYNTIHHDPMYKNERTGPWRLEELDFTETPDYWTRLEHQYAGMAMQGILSNPDVNLDYKSYECMPQAVAATACNIAHALVEKMKNQSV